MSHIPSGISGLLLQMCGSLWVKGMAWCAHRNVLGSASGFLGAQLPLLGTAVHRQPPHSCQLTVTAEGII